MNMQFPETMKELKKKENDLIKLIVMFKDQIELLSSSDPGEVRRLFRGINQGDHYYPKIEMTERNLDLCSQCLEECKQRCREYRQTFDEYVSIINLAKVGTLEGLARDKINDFGMTPEGVFKTVMDQPYKR